MMMFHMDRNKRLLSVTNFAIIVLISLLSSCKDYKMRMVILTFG